VYALQEAWRPAPALALTHRWLGLLGLALVVLADLVVPDLYARQGGADLAAVAAALALAGVLAFDASAWERARLERIGHECFGALVVRLHDGTRDTDYHYGIAPQAPVPLRGIFGDRASLGQATRQHFVTRLASDSSGRGGHDTSIRGGGANDWRSGYERSNF